VKRPLPEEAETAAVARKSLVAAVDIPAGTLITREMMAVKRPGTGMAPSRLESVVGRRARKTIESGTLVTPDMF